MSEKVAYTTPYSPSFRIALGGKTFQAQNGVLMLDPEYAAELDAMIASGERGDVAQQVKKVDVEAAKRQAEKFLASQKPQAMQGVVQSKNPATEAARAAHLAQTSETLTGKSHPVNISTQPNNTEPLKVQEVPIAADPGAQPLKTGGTSVLDALRKKSDIAS